MKINTKGLSVLESLIAISVGLIGMFAMTQLLHSQSKESRHLAEKMARIDLDRNLSTIFSQPTLCNRMLVDSSYDASNPRSFDPTLVGTGTPPELSFPANQIIASPTGTTAGPAVFKVGQFADQASNLRVAQISLKDIVLVGPDRYQGNVVVSFDDAILIKPLRPITSSIFFSTTAANPAVITSCHLSSGNSGSGIDIVYSPEVTGFIPEPTDASPFTIIREATCPDSYIAIQCLFCKDDVGACAPNMYQYGSADVWEEATSRAQVEVIVFNNPADQRKCSLLLSGFAQVTPVNMTRPFANAWFSRTFRLRAKCIRSVR